MNEREIQEMMEICCVTREYAIELLELEAASQIIFPVEDDIDIGFARPADDYQNYLNGPIDPRD